ncbi:hypothetical protein [Streptomyces sp. NPDC005423]|uniref:hypothetical protein n=1 Tax=Streptomyces sp. NPDC005423 TaxID=3155343 RepID=UPI0033AFB534
MNAPWKKGHAPLSRRPPGPADHFGITSTAVTATATAALAGNGRTVEYKAAAGQLNTATVTASTTAGTATITYVIDDTVPITTGDGRTHPAASDRTKVTCVVTTEDSQDPYPALTIALGDGNDVLTYRNGIGQVYYYTSIDAGPGKDRVTDTGALDGGYVSGGSGTDVIHQNRPAPGRP